MMMMEAIDRLLMQSSFIEELLNKNNKYVEQRNWNWKSVRSLLKQESKSDHPSNAKLHNTSH